MDLANFLARRVVLEIGPKGQPDISPGRQPGVTRHKIGSALKGRYEMGAHRQFCRPCRGLVCLNGCSGGSRPRLISGCPSGTIRWLRKYLNGSSLRLWAATAMVMALALLAGCRPPEHVTEEATPSPTATPLPTPEPSPTPLYVPYKRLDTGRLFNGVTLQTTFSTEPGGAATAEVTSSSSYTLHLDLNVRIPRAVSSQGDLTALNPALPALFPALPQWMKAAKVSPFYERLYRHKVNSIQQSLLRLDQLLNRHDFYDCDTILEIQPPVTGTAAPAPKILWIQSDMDVDSDGSDSDRVPNVDANSQTFQPLTSYKWTKRGANPNPFVAEREAHLVQLQGNLALASNDAQRHAIRQAIEDTRYEINQLRINSFLVASTDPYIVVPGCVFHQSDDAFSPGVGDYCAVVYGNAIYPAIVGDVGPLNKIGEASLRIAQQLNPLATSENRPVSALKIAYLVFPGTAEKPWGPPDLNHWHDRVDALLKSAGGYTGPLFAWKDLTVPPPTPTPSPSPTPTATPSPSGTPAASPTPPVKSGS